MRIWVYAICRNERLLIEYFLRHYSAFAEKIIIFDDDSDDGTREIIAACPNAELRDWPGDEGINDDQFQWFANTQWHEARGKADWIFWVDVDEIVYHPKMLDLLASYHKNGVTGPQIAGYTMVSQGFPTTKGQIYDEVKTGFPDEIWTKQAVFREGIHFNLGRHSLDRSRYNPRPSLTAEMKLLHYRALGKAYVWWRHNRNWNRLPQRCQRAGYGHNTAPSFRGEYSTEWFYEQIDKSWPEVVP